MPRSTSPSGRAVIAGDPAAEREQFAVEHRFGIDQAQGLARGHGGALVVAAQDDASELAGSEGHQDAAAGPRRGGAGFRAAHR